MMDSNSRGRVLVVDDNASSLKGMGLLLNQAGYEVTSTEDPKQALAWIREQDFSALVADIRMPGLSGLGLVRRIREGIKPLATILVTGEPGLDTAIDAVSVGALRYLVKPVQPGDFREAVDHAVTMTRIWRIQNEAVAGLHARPGDDEKARLDKALETMWTAYQPVYNVSGTVVGYEALVRPGTSAFEDADALFREVSAQGRMREFGRLLRTNAIREWRDSPARNRDLYLNVHPEELADPDFFSESSPLWEHRAQLVLEISESADFAAMGNSNDVMNRLIETGIRFTLDQLGAGRTMLDFLVEFKPAFTKLDRSLVTGIHQSHKQQEVVKNICDLCASLGIEVIAAGLERQEDAKVIGELGVTYLQGYLFGAPRELRNGGDSIS